MDTITSNSAAAELDASPFDSVKARHLLGWVVAAFLVALVIFLFTESPLVEDIVIYAVVYGVPIVWFLCRAKKRGLLLGNLAGKLPKSKKWLLYPLLNIPVILLSLGSIIVIYAYIARQWPGVVSELLTHDTTTQTKFPIWGTLLETIGALVLAPIVEEFIFRGFLLHRWARKWGTVRAIIFVSVVFGILHVNFFGAAAFSILLCVVYIYTRSIIPSIVLHFVNNVISSWPSASTAETTALTASELNASLITGWIMIAVSVPFFVWFIRTHWPGENAILPYYVRKNSELL